MSTKLKVRLKHAEGALVRLLGQIGRRGYDVREFSARLSADGRTFDVLVEFEPFVPMPPGKSRPVEVLPALVRKLVDVESADLVEGTVPKPETPGPARAPAARPAGEMKWEE